jgi:hypothetical protein
MSFYSFDENELQDFLESYISDDTQDLYSYALLEDKIITEYHKFYH